MIEAEVVKPLKMGLCVVAVLPDEVEVFHGRQKTHSTVFADDQRSTRLAEFQEWIDHRHVERCDCAGGKLQRNMKRVGEIVSRINLGCTQPANRENVTLIMDTGQWRGSVGAAGDPDPSVDIYAYMEQTLPEACYVRAKVYKIASGREELLDYERIAKILKRQGYNGSISIVYEGREDGDRVELINKAAVHLRDLLEPDR